jgi:hypothetical protein
VSYATFRLPKGRHCWLCFIQNIRRICSWQDTSPPWLVSSFLPPKYTESCFPGSFLSLPFFFLCWKHKDLPLTLTGLNSCKAKPYVQGIKIRAHVRWYAPGREHYWNKGLWEAVVEHRHSFDDAFNEGLYQALRCIRSLLWQSADFTGHDT